MMLNINLTLIDDQSAGFLYRIHFCTCNSILRHRIIDAILWSQVIS